MVYPNPTQGQVNIQLLADDLNQPDNIRKLELYNTQGVLVKSFYNVPDGMVVDWNLEQLASGLFYLQAVDQKGEGYSGKVMIQR